MKKILTLLLLAVAATIAAQTGTWKAHMSYNEPQQIVEGDGYVFVRASNSLYQYNPADGSIVTFDKVRQLSDTYIERIAWSDEAHRLLVVYDNSNLDLLDTKENVVNLSSLYNKSMMQEKTVNNTFVDGIYIYLCTHFGLVKVNMQRAEISETYMLNRNVTHMALSADHIFARTIADDGAVTILAAPRTSNLLDSHNWTATDTAPDGAFADDNGDWDKHIATVSTLAPGGPRYNTFGFMRFQRNRLLTCSGNISTSQATGQMLDTDGEWSFLKENFSDVTTLDRFGRMYALVEDPKEDGHYFAATRSGLYEYRSNAMIKHFNHANSPIRSAIDTAANPVSYMYYEKVTNAIFDDDGNLWLLNSQTAEYPLMKFTQERRWVTYSLPALMKLENRALAELTSMMVDSQGRIWFCNYNWSTPSFYCFKPDTEELRAFTQFVNQDGQTTTIYNGASSIVEDDDHNFWIGTTNGLFMLEADQVDADDYHLTQVKVPRNDGTDYADYLLAGVNVSCLAIDGGGRKWVGTRGNGVYVISADNMVEEYHFESATSPLLSDDILSITFNPSTGETFIGTDRGLCSYMSDATEPDAIIEKANVYAYPNPVQSGYEGLISIVGLTNDADVKILSTSGKLIAQGRSKGGMFTWNGRDAQGRRVASGVYMVAVATSDGKKGTVCKIAVIR